MIIFAICFLNPNISKSKQLFWGIYQPDLIRNHDFEGEFYQRTFKDNVVILEAGCDMKHAKKLREGTSLGTTKL